MKIEFIGESLSTKRTIAAKLESLPSMAKGFVRAVHFTGYYEDRIKSILKRGILLKMGSGEYATNYSDISSVCNRYSQDGFWEMLVTKPHSHKATKGCYVIMDMPYNDWLCYDNPQIAGMLKAVSPNHIVGIVPIDTENIDKGYIAKAREMSLKNPPYTYKRFGEHVEELRKRVSAMENKFKKKVMKAVSAGEDISGYMNMLEPFSYVFDEDEKFGRICKKYMERYMESHKEPEPEQPQANGDSWDWGETF